MQDSRENNKIRKLRQIRISKQSRNRMISVLFFICFVFLILISGLGYWQFVQGDDLTRRAYDMQSRDREILPRRGTIYDRTGKPLAISANVNKVVINPTTINNQNAKLSTEELGKGLAKILGVPYKDVKEKINRQSYYEQIKRQVEKAEADKLRQWIKDNDVAGVYLTEDTKRYYPNRNFASQVLGFTGYDNQGLNGLEIMLDDYLKGSKGKVSIGLDGRNRELPITEEKRVSATDGYNVHLTLDETIQYFAEKAIDQAIVDHNCKNGAVAIVSDPRTGDILALVSKPDYDPNNPYGPPKIDGVDSKTWKGNQSSEDVKLLNETVWRNKAISDTYEPGSTFKAVTTAAGLEEGVITPETMVNDSPVTVSGKKINCWRVGNLHGTETLREAVYNSCNPVFTNIGLDLGIEKFYGYMRAFGFGQKTGVQLPAEGINLIHKSPTQLDLAVASFGQRFTVTPLQMVMAYGAIANGGTLMKPRLVTEVSDNSGNVVKRFDPAPVRRVISQKTSDSIRDILRGVVAEGTGRQAYVPGYNVAGKTGTSETTESKSSGRYIASFSAFAPADNPVICVLVILDHPTGPVGHTGGMTAAPVAKKIVEDTLTYLEVGRKYTSKDQTLVGKVVKVPNLVGKTFGEAKKILASEKYGLKYKISGYLEGSNDDIITDQMPKDGITMSVKSEMVLFLDKGTDSKNIH